MLIEAGRFTVRLAENEAEVAELKKDLVKGVVFHYAERFEYVFAVVFARQRSPSVAASKTRASVQKASSRKRAERTVAGKRKAASKRKTVGKRKAAGG